MNSRSRSLSLIAALLSFSASLAFTGCSPEMFDQKKSDSNIENQTGYRRAQPSCLSLDLSSNEFDVKTLRALMKCFNGNGSIDDLVKLLDESSDSQVNSIVSLVNRSFLKDKTRLYQSRLTLHEMKRRGELEKNIEGLGSILASADRTRAILEIIDSARGTRLEPNAAEKKSLAAWMKKLGPESFLRTVVILEKIVHSPAYGRLREKLRTATLTDAEAKKLAQAWKTLVAKPETSLLGNQLIQSLAAGKASKLLSLTIGEDEEEIRKNVPETALVIRTLFGGQAKTWNSLSRLHRAFEAPISCLKGGKVFKEPWKDLETELKRHSGDAFFDFVTRFGASSTLGAAGALCELPELFYENYPAFLELHTTNAGQILNRVIERAYREDFASTLGRWMSKSGETIAPIVSALDHRDLTTDLLLILAELDDTDRDFLGTAVLALFKREGDAPSSWSQLSNWASRLTVEQWLEVSDLFSQAMGTDEMSLAQAMTALKEFTLSNSSHPWFEGIREILLDSLTGSGNLFSLSEMARLPSFGRATTLLHEMSQDGRLMSMILGTLDLVGRYAEQGRVDMDLSRLPFVIQKDRHEFSSADLPILSLKKQASKSLLACTKLNLKGSLDRQVETYFDCLGSQPSLRSAEEAFKILAEQKTSAGVSYAALVSGWVKNLPFITTKEAEEFTRDVNRVIRSGRLESSSQAIESLLFGSGARLGVLEPSLKLAQQLQLASAADWRILLDGIGKSISHADAAKSIQLISSAARKEPTPIRTRRANAYDAPRIERWVRNKECVTDASIVRAKRELIVEQYENAVSGWELVNGFQRETWGGGELWSRLEPALKRLARPGLSASVGLLFQRLAGHPEAVIDWFKRRSNDYRLVSTIHPGEEYPRVRLMSSLDRLEVLLKSADFKYLFPENFALKFMAMIGEAWGDEPREKWPEEIRRRYSGSARPATLSETFQEMKKTLEKYADLGALPRVSRCEQLSNPSDDAATQREETTDPTPFIGAPNIIVPKWVKANVFNLHQVISVIEENLPGSGTPNDSGMKFLRDIFYHVYSGSAPAGRTASDPSKNELGLILDLSEVSFLRALSLYFMNLEDPTLIQAHADLLRLAGDLMTPAEGVRWLQGLMSGEGLALLKAFYEHVHSLSLSDRKQLGKTFDAIVLWGAEAGRLNVGSAFSSGLAPSLPSLYPALRARIAEFTGIFIDWTRVSLPEKFARSLYQQSSRDLHAGFGAWLQAMLTNRAFMEASIRASKLALTHEEVRVSLKQLADRYEDFSETSDYRRYEVAKTLKDLIDYFGQTDGSISSQTASRVRVWVGARLHAQAQGSKPSELEEILNLGIREPDQFSKVMKGVLQGSRSPSFEEFMEILSRHLPR